MKEPRIYMNKENGMPFSLLLGIDWFDCLPVPGRHWRSRLFRYENQASVLAVERKRNGVRQVGQYRVNRWTAVDDARIG